MGQQVIDNGVHLPDVRRQPGVNFLCVRSRPARPQLVLQTSQPVLIEAFQPESDGILADGELPGDR